MAAGGNHLLYNYIEYYNLDGIQDIKIKYQTRALLFYRRRLIAKADSLQFDEEELAYDEGRQMEDGGFLLDNGKVVYHRTDSAMEATVVMDATE